MGAAELGDEVTRHRAYRHLKSVFDEGASTLIKPLTWQGDMSLGQARDGRATFQRLDDNPRWRGVPDLDDAGPVAVTSLVAKRPSDAVRFLPGHDQWVMGPGTKDPHVTPSSLRDLITRKANPVVVGGVVRGAWSRRGDAVTVKWLEERPRPDRAIADECRRLARLLATDLHLTF